MKKTIYEDADFDLAVNERPGSYGTGANTREFSYDVKEHIGILSSNGNGWNKELNIISWSGNPDKFDIRTWNAEHNRMYRGITLTEEEAKALGDLLQSRFSPLNSTEVSA